MLPSPMEVSGPDLSTFDAARLHRPRRWPGYALAITLGSAVIYGACQLSAALALDQPATWLMYALLAAALVVALGFEFVNGLHDAANAVAMVIYTHSLPPHVAVAWSGLWNFIGVLASSGAVAFSVVAMLPALALQQVGSVESFAMLFALLTAASVWNLATGHLGLPSSGTHTLLGSVLGVSLARRVLRPQAASEVGWHEALRGLESMLISPLIGFVAAASLLWVARRAAPDPRLHRAATDKRPPPAWIRALLISTCTGVSFAHGSNDGQKGLGFVMLILIGTLPATYALDHGLSNEQTRVFVARSEALAAALERRTPAAPAIAARAELQEFLATRRWRPTTAPALAQLMRELGRDLKHFGSLRAVPAAETRRVRQDLLMVGDTLRLCDEQGELQLSKAERSIAHESRAYIDRATRFVPAWVKFVVALALGLGTLVGWKSIVVTVGEKIGTTHLTYAQGAAAEITTLATIGAADILGLPVSTTHVLASGVAGTMIAHGSGLRRRTIYTVVAAWLLTLPASIALSAGLFALFVRLLTH